ncbi:acyl-CoA thioesterase [bacterium]|nr:acyl-CoA thioesterase [bacterium]MCB2179102.1 acyl-CoA thioesterase [bacterium]
MSEQPKFFHPIEVRYGDIDAQGHVNNAKFLTYFEHGRTYYMRHLNLYPVGLSFMEIGVILADVQITFFKPVHWEDQVQVGVKTTQMGNKSITMLQTIADRQTGEEFARGRVVMVAYDYHEGKTVPIPEAWREIISAYEGD